MVKTNPTDLIAGAAPWLAPIPTAYLVGKSTMDYLAWPLPVAIVAAAIIESLGLAAVHTALELREYNQARRKTDPIAPAWLAGVMVGGYVIVAIGLTVMLDIIPELARIAPAIFPLLSLAGVAILALRADHGRRLAAIATEKATRKAERQAARQASSVNRKPARKVSSVNRQASSVNPDKLLDVYRQDPLTGPTQAAQALGVSRQAIYDNLAKLEQSGVIRRNGGGVEVL